MSVPMRTPEEQREYQRQWVARRRAEWFADKCCIDCGSTDRLELDHVDPSQKISHSIWSWSKSRRAIEIAKCVVRCFPCHRVKTVLNKENAHGESMYSSKLSVVQIVEIRERLSCGESQRYIADLYEVSQATIHRIHSGKNWSHVE